ncbi:hypothetical protein BEL04_12520 [Mucilaginibacter sp. PPCGB 2223]|uniref:DUF72 domain-containing protein n=1 Tax=Mucilaginibacter sp. PPCGB 2223 TaxID=1886027 RepID=UPI0008250ED2|nr:DUF72 domain-containing protein [Mucilaginibacter sp. PPCGB 2223]OCX52294.1 hypothetical protein BEL04_12520 [Mucilaginibacter sp. PPCGB 2223]
MRGQFYSGTSNIVLPVANKTLFPQAYQCKSRLCYYGSLLNSLEINSTFYKIPLARTIERWATEVPDDFKFTFKLWRGITHNKGLAFAEEDVRRFMQVITGAGAKAGCLLVQFPASVTITYGKQLERLLGCLQDNDPGDRWDIAIEFRSKTWYTDTVFKLLDEHKMGLVLHDMPASAAPMMETEADFVYLRFHGTESNYRGSYADDYLAEYAGYINDWRNGGKTVYAYFNNTLGSALQNLQTLNAYVNDQE